MGSAASRHLGCLGGGGGGGAGREAAQLDEELGHSFCYVRSPRPTSDPAFRSISGASVSANSSAPLPLLDNAAAAPAFQSSASFAALPLQLSSTSGPLDRGFFLSGPIESGALSGPLDPSFSGPLFKKRARRARGGSFSGALSKVSLLRRSLSERSRRPWVVPLRGGPPAAEPRGEPTVQWARGKAGEDRAHVVVSEDRRWLFVGIYDGFNGPDAPDYLLSHLYPAVHREVDGLFWDEAQAGGDEALDDDRDVPRVTKRLWEFLAEGDGDGELGFSASGRLAFSISKLKHGLGSWRKDSGDRGWFPRWRSHAEERTKSDAGRHRWKKARHVVDHQLVLGALSRALVATEAGYLEMTDRAMNCSPELALMGSCLLVVLMRDEDVYVMNVGDSRAIVARYRPRVIDDGGIGGTMDIMDDEALGREGLELEALQLSTDHNTNIAEEVLRIREEHPDDDQCIVNDRVKGRLKVTRAFGAGFLKQPKWNNALLEMFRNEYIGTAPYISCAPSLCHHELGPDDQFLVLSSDGLYQYLSNQEVVLYVENFMEKFPDGDPAQSLIEELLFRAAKKAGMDFYELLDIPQGDRRKYHDDVTVMVISLEGRIWKSSGKCL